MNNRDIRDNPTANHKLQQIDTKYNPIKAVSGLKDLKLLCTRCTVFENETALKKIYMDHDERNELYRCSNCNNVHSESQVRYALRLELPEYIYYDKTRNITDVAKQREREEKFIIQPINIQSPTDLLNKVGVRAIKNKTPSPLSHNTP